jgi:hypothetical protein
VASAAPRRRRSWSSRAIASRQPAGGTAALPSPAMASFFIDTDTGQVATLRQLTEAGVAGTVDPPPRPWHPIQGTRDATTMWYAVMRKRERGVFIGTLVLRHTDHHASLLQSGWQEVEVADIGVAGAT